MKTNNHSFRPLTGLTTSLAVFLLGIAASDPASAAQTNTKTGEKAGASVTTGKSNTANGYKALEKNKTGAGNTAVGADSLKGNVRGARNTALGMAALQRTTGSENVAVGFKALFTNSSGAFNVAIGNGSLLQNTTGNNNIGIGVDAGAKLTTGNDNICIDNPGVAGESGIIRLGTPGTHTDTYIAGKIRGDGSGLTGVAAATVTGAISGTQITAATITGTQIAPTTITGANLTSNITLSGTTTGTFSGPLTGNASTATDASNIAASDRKLSVRAVGSFGQTTAFNFNSGSNGLLLETSGNGNSSDSAGLFLNGNTAAIYSPGDTGAILSVYDEDALGGTTPVAAFRVLDGTGGISVTGDVKLGSTAQLSAVGGEEQLRIIRGAGTANVVVNGASLQPIHGSGFTYKKISQGVVEVTFTTQFSGTPTVTANAISTGSIFCGLEGLGGGGNPGSTGFRITMFDTDANPRDWPFNFIAIGPR